MTSLAGCPSPIRRRSFLVRLLAAFAVAILPGYVYGTSVRASVEAQKPIAEIGSISVFLDEGGTATAPQERWHLRVIDGNAGETSVILVNGTDAFGVPTLEGVAVDSSAKRLSLIFPDAVVVVDIGAKRHLASIPGYGFKASPNGRLLTFIEHYARTSVPDVETRRLVDVRALSSAFASQSLRNSVTMGAPLLPTGTADGRPAGKWARQSATTWLSDDTLAFAIYDAESDASQVVVVRGLPDKPAQSIVDVDAVSIVRDAGQARSASEALHVQRITALGQTPLRLRLKFRDDYLLNARTLDLTVP